MTRKNTAGKGSVFEGDLSAQKRRGNVYISGDKLMLRTDVPRLKSMTEEPSAGCPADKREAKQKRVKASEVGLLSAGQYACGITSYRREAPFSPGFQPWALSA
jgi:hypothetical protein